MGKKAKLAAKPCELEKDFIFEFIYMHMYATSDS